ncbi:conserved hypothetical protein [Pseudomonas veronii]|uniref:hypothetical protein n=1 Tax=Pseudomonas veronii TaxID=76761 RepID=UPI00175582E6|nr:hypothetical protein [Pseudomonas veronii]CAD0264245.1 conserved hypothetical protein [Pseudomonas veronii]
MATTLSKEQIEQRAAAEVAVNSVRKDKPLPIGKESELCELFIREFGKIEGWTCYPEAAGFDVLVVHQDGRQIGVEAKLSLNAKVADQILPNYGDDYYGRPGPDHRLVIVSKITDASAGIAKMLHRLGVKVLSPRQTWERTGYEHTFDLKHSLLADETGNTFFGRERLFDWSPVERCYVPAIVSDLPAGVPSPVRLTPWKEAAVKLVALMRSQGFITVKQIAAHGMGSTSWTQPAGSKPAWLAKGTSRGQWVETEHMPPFDKQHPDLYAIAVEALVAEVRKKFVLV